MRHALEHVDGLRERGVDATASLEELRRRIDVPLTADSLDAERVIEELVAACDGGIVGSAGPRFFGFVIGGSLPAALAADWMTSAWDQNAGLYVIGPAAALVEEVAGGWLKSLFGLPAEASFAFVTGCQMAHVTCLAAARHQGAGARGMGCGARRPERSAGDSDSHEHRATCDGAASGAAAGNGHRMR